MVNIKKNSSNIVIILIVAVIVGVTAFFMGMKYQQSKNATLTASSNPTQRVRSNNKFGGRFGRLSGNIVGDVLTVNSTSLAVKLGDGSSKLVNLSSSTKYNKEAKVALSDIKTGTKVAVFGVSNSDGSITAYNVLLNPIQRNGR